ncbi:hypothetical protein B0H19DRAFT_1247815 [Mycena capillaripes]|nr:hypothetical protein B0H19DRAFT_1247815 [Mycena capillaripes]
MQMFSLLLQLRVLLFATALSVYLGTIPLAIIVPSITSFGVITYIKLLVSATLLVDSAFETPPVPLVAGLIPTTLLTKAPGYHTKGRLSRVDDAANSVEKAGAGYKAPFSTAIHQLYSTRSSFIRDRLPPFFKRKSPWPLPDPSPEVSAVSWVLEISTDPVIIAAAAEIAMELQGPMSVGITRLRDTVLRCFECEGVYKITEDGPVKGVRLIRIRDGMDSCAVQCGQAYGLLCSYLGTVQPLPKYDEGMVYRADYRTFESTQLRNVVRILKGSHRLTIDFNTSPQVMDWALCAIPSLVGYSGRKLELIWFLEQFKLDKMPALDPHIFTNDLLCLN